MRLVRIARAVWDVWAVADDDSGHSVWNELVAADPSDDGAERMRAALSEDIPRNGPPKGRTRCKDLGDDIYEFKEWNVRVLWFYDTGQPVERFTIVCTHWCPKLNKKKFQQEKSRAMRVRKEYIAEKAAGRLRKPEDRP